MSTWEINFYLPTDSDAVEYIQLKFHVVENDHKEKKTNRTSISGLGTL